MERNAFSFSQIFSGLTQTQSRTNSLEAVSGKVYKSIPEAPVLGHIPDIDVLLNGESDFFSEAGLPTLYPSEVTTAGNNVQASKSSTTGVYKKPVPINSISERGDGDTIYLGSQFPLVHRIRNSQGERHQMDNHMTVLVNPVPRSPDNAAVILTAEKELEKRNNKELPIQLGSERQWNKRNNRETLVWKSSRPTAKPPSAIILPSSSKGGFKLRSVREMPERYREVFKFPYFNIVQSKVFDDVMYTDRPLVLCSPTGSGKTAVFEMAIIRLLQQSQAQNCINLKVVYMAPIKALCSEKFTDWKAKFEPLGLKVMELTGDTDTDDFYELQEVNIILTTPEKWDSMTRKWRDNRTVMEAICLFLVDEIHVLNDPTRGATVEAVLSRMKTIQAAGSRSKTTQPALNSLGLRFLAVSATITNIEDLAEWLGNKTSNPALYYKFDDSVRPVRLRKVVLGFYFAENKSDFQFDITLSYKLTGIIHTYAENKPTLVFCATRKSAIQGAEILARDGKHSYIHSGQHRQQLQNLSFHIKDTKLRDLVTRGIGYHHAGMDLQDRKNIEQMFAGGDLPVLVATSTLAMGVNLPAHLVIVKSTMYYHMGVHTEYSDTQVLQMIGRAGRPQFDTSATAVIMTKNQTKMKYENLLNGTQLLESSLHRNLIEHLNAEIVLHTISDMSVAVEWLKYTFLYIRVMKNPKHYGMPAGLSSSMIEKRLQEMCMQSLNQLHGLSLIAMDQETLDVKPTETGRLMARYCISYKTAELFHNIGGTESVCELLSLLSHCEEFSDITLRTNEKRALNTLNKDKNRITIRYPMNGKIKTTDMKVNCLIQAQFGCLLVQEFALLQDTSRIFRAGMRITRCLVEFLSQKSDYKSLLSGLLLCKCFKAKLWEDSKYVSRQLEGIGPTLSTAMVNSGLITFEKIEQTNPREIELIVNRHPPFGNQVRSSVAKLPKYEIVIEQASRYSLRTAEIVITVQLANKEDLQNIASISNHTCTLLIGDADNHVVHKQRIMDKLLQKENSWCRKLEIRLADKGPELHVHYISQEYVGLDVDCTYTPIYLGGNRISTTSIPKTPLQAATDTSNSWIGKPCQHACHNKDTCGHECCKTGLASKRKPPKTPQIDKPPNTTTRKVSSFLSKLKNKASSLPQTPSTAKRLRMNDNDPPVIDLTRFAYTTNKKPLSVNPVTILQEPTQVINVPNRQNQFQKRPQNLDWAELNMYQKCRKIHRADESSKFQAQDSLPDIPAVDQVLADPMHSWEAGVSRNMPQNWDEDFGQETDFGYTYVHTQDRQDIPENCDNQMTDQLNKKPWIARDEDFGQETDFGYTYVHTQDRQDIPENCDNQMTDQLNKKPWIARDEDFGQETDFGYTYVHTQDRQDIPENCDNQMTDQLNKKPWIARSARSPNRQSTLQRSSSYKSVRGNFKPQRRDQDQINKLSSEPLYYPGAKPSAEHCSYDIEDFSEDEEYLAIDKTEEGIHCESNVPRQGFNSLSDDTISRYNSFSGDRVQWLGRPDTDEMDLQVANNCEENNVLENFDDTRGVECVQDLPDNSKWESYCDTQESSTSDCLNWQYPSRNGQGVVMEKRKLGLSQMETQTGCANVSQFVPQRALQDTLHVAVTEKADGPVSEKANQYGQVLAWLSDTEHQTTGSKHNTSLDWEPWSSQEAAQIAEAELISKTHTGHQQLTGNLRAQAIKTDRDFDDGTEYSTNRQTSIGTCPTLMAGHSTSTVQNSQTKTQSFDHCAVIQHKKKPLSLVQGTPKLSGETEVTKKPRFSSFFTKNKTDTPVKQDFYNIFEGLF